VDPVLEARLRETFARSRAVVLQAHERAQQAVERSARIREALRADRQELHQGQREARRRVRLLQLAAEESARTVREKDLFVATVSHELRQPLNAALAALRLIEVGGPAAGTAREVLRRQLLQMTRLVDDLLDVARVSLEVMDLRLDHVDLGAVLDDSIATIEPELHVKRLSFELTRFETHVCVWGDDSRLRQVFSNLLANAVRYTPAGGRITVAGAVEGPQVFVSVADTGQGINQADLSRIFDPLARGGGTAQEGLGIGLSVVRALVALHRGHTTVSSAGQGLGSTFTVSLPLCPHSTVKGAARDSV
jgi:signal transduction histidine kinase